MTDPAFEKDLARETSRRRTFGIISHPDAGKTTLTEKLLLFGGAIQMAGTVKARKAARYATSDWMAMERERGISVTSSVMQFEYEGYAINLLDTPGHQDFSEDTYRVLTAVDSAVMVIDSAKGVETQTKKLMEVCRLRDTPIITFINKMDREGREPLDLLSDIEESLGIECAAMTWPIGMGKGFKGTWNIQKNELHLFSATHGGKIQAGLVIKGLDDPRLDELLGSQAADLRRDMELVSGAGYPFDRERYLAGKQTPVFFGSAINNFGVQEMLGAFVALAPQPRPRVAQTGVTQTGVTQTGVTQTGGQTGKQEQREVAPTEPEFSGVVFKIQANMDPAHRDRIAFLRICSGRFQRGMKLRHHRIGKDVTVSNATIFMAQDRTNVDEAWPGDIIGLHNHGTIKIGDTFSEHEPLKFTGIPSFAPEHFRRVILKSPLKAKQLQKGLAQLAEEGAVQVFRPLMGNEYILGAVGVLQFDVIVARLKDEYGVEALYEPAQYNCARFINATDKRKLADFERALHGSLAKDAEDNLAYLAPSQWRLEDTQEKWPDIAFNTIREHE